MGLTMAIATVGYANAATLGGITTRTLGAFSVSGGSSAPTVAGCDDFTGTNGVSLNSRAATVAAPCANRTWTVHVGAWTIQSNRAAANATAAAVATQNVTASGASARVELTSLNTGSRSGGVVVSHNGTTTYLAAVAIDGSPDRTELRLVNAGVPTVLASANTPLATTNTIRLSRAGAAVTVELDSSTVLSYTLSAANQTTLGTGTRPGIYSGNTNVRFDNFLTDRP